jgi:hypothetical protein
MIPLLIALVAGFAGYTIGHHKMRVLPQNTPVNNQLPTFVNGTAVGVPKYNALQAPNRPDQVYASRQSGPDSVTTGGAQYTPAFGPQENMPSSNLESF